MENARLLIQTIVHDHKRMQESLLRAGLGECNPFEGQKKYVPIQEIYADVIIGVYGQQIKTLYQRTGCQIFVPKETNADNERIFQLSGTYDQVERCKYELISLLQACQAYIFGQLQN